MTEYTRFKYSGATPGADSSDYILFSTVTAFGGKCAHQMAGLHKLVLDLFHTQAGTLKLYRSNDRGTTWTQVTSSAKSAPAAGLSSQYEVLVECFPDFKLVWTNGGSAQATWYPDVALTDERCVAVPGGGEYPETLSSLVAWWAGDTVTFAGTEADGEKLSGASNKVNPGTANLAQGTSANQPRWRAADATMNNQPTFGMVITSAFSTVLPAPSTAQTHFGCGYYTDDGSGIIGFYGQTIAGANASGHDFWFSTNAMVVRRTGGAQFTSAGPIAMPRKIAYVTKPSAAGVTMYFNSLTPEVFAGASATWDALAPTMDDFFLGVLSNTLNRPFTGSIGEHGIYDRACTAAECEGIMSYLSTKYAVTLV